MGESQPGQAPEPGQDPLAEAIRNGIYTAVGLGLLAVNRVQAARRELAGQLPGDLRDAFAELAGQVPEDVRDAFAELAGQVPEDVRDAVAELARQMPDSVSKLLSDAVDQAPAIAEALRELVRRSDGA